MEITDLAGRKQDGRGLDIYKQGTATSGQFSDPGLQVLLCDLCDRTAFSELSPGRYMFYFGLEQLDISFLK